MPRLLSISCRSEPVPKAEKSSFSFERFGNLRRAKIELSELTLLVGRNNTGKSYLACLIWAFRNFHSAVTGRKADERPTTPDWLKQFANADHAMNGFQPREVKAEEIEGAVNEWLSRSGNAFVRRLLSYAEAEIDGLKISLYGSLWLSPRPAPHPAFGDLSSFEASAWEISWTRPEHPAGSYLNEKLYSPTMIMSGDDYEYNLFEAMVQMFLTRRYLGWSETIYIPAARTGLMLALPSLNAALFDRLGIDPASSSSSQLPLPTIRFIQALVRDRGAREVSSPLSEVADFLEENVLYGHVRQDAKDRVKFEYKPSGSRSMLPLHASSSLVGELAPFLELLRAGWGSGGFVFEEPEAHLHLSAQRSMARAIARLVNSHLHMAVTTHSDTFVQQINVLIRLYSHPEREKLIAELGYDISETISPATVTCYEVSRRTNRSASYVRRIDPSADGLAVPSLNETIMSLAEEAIETSLPS